MSLRPSNWGTLGFWEEGRVNPGGRKQRKASRAVCPASPDVLEARGLPAPSLTCALSPLPGAGLLTLFHKYPEYVCVKKGGTCNFSPCPRFTKIEGTCYQGRAKCCI